MLINPTIKPTKIGGYWLYANYESSPGREIIMNGLNYEKHVRAELERLVPDSVGFLDVGANVGIHTLSVKTIKPDLRVVAVEMAPANIELLAQTVKLNGWEASVTVVPVAVAPCPMMVAVNRDPTNPCASVDYKPSDATWASGFPDLRPALPLDFFALPKIDLVKMDIEGFEYAAWQGASKLFEMRPRMIFEFCLDVIYRSGVAPLEQLQWLLARGYRVTVLDNYLEGLRVPCATAYDVLKRVEAMRHHLADLLAEPV